ncbi:DUF6544 family protein [Nocardioides ochotonae]|uniref:DUF6544 family protein n=1 Tax=Nocardioides ochotonae TaxID=2685869 RepID=UPI001408FDB7|nr:DUF6544 family protein [Nocardioides ochotonae]
MRTRRTETGGNLAAWQARLLTPAPPEVFGAEELDGLPEPVRRHLSAAIAPGTPLARGATLTMRGSLRLGPRWLPFRAVEVLDPHVGFVWGARVGGLIAGSDQYVDGAGAMRWRLAGLLTVAQGEGPDVSRSAAGRGGAEGVWVPTALLPRYGVRWSAEDDTHVTVHHRLGDNPVDVRCTLDDDGLLRSFVLERWGDPDDTGSWGWHPFGGEITEHRTFGGLTIPARGTVGWHHGTDRWAAGEFFRFDVGSLRVPSPASPESPAAPPHHQGCETVGGDISERGGRTSERRRATSPQRRAST